MKKIFLLVMILGFVCNGGLNTSSHFSFAQGSDEVGLKLKEMFNVSGVSDNMDNLADQFIQGLRAQTDMGFGELEDLVYEVFDPDKMFEVFKKEYSKDWNLGYADDIIASYKKSLLQRFVERENFSNTEEGMAAFQEYAQNFLTNNYATPERIALVNELNNMLGVVDSGVELAVSTGKSMATAFNEMADMDARVSQEKLDGMIVGLEKNMRSQLTQAVLMQYLFLYQNFTDDELRSYMDFHKTAAMRWMIDHFKEGYKKVMHDGTAQFTAGFVECLKRVQKEQEDEEETSATRP